MLYLSVYRKTKNYLTLILIPTPPYLYHLCPEKIRHFWGGEKMVDHTKCCIKKYSPISIHCPR